MCYLYIMNNTYINIDKPETLIIKNNNLHIIQEKTIVFPFEESKSSFGIFWN